MAETSPQEESLRDLVRLAIGFLFGSGIAGGAVVMIRDTPDARPWGILIFVLCLVSAGVLFWWSERKVDLRAQLRLQKLGTAYTRALNTTGQRLVDKLETGSAKGSLETGNMRPYILQNLATMLQRELRQPLGGEEEDEWARVFRHSIQETVNEWRALAAAEREAGYFPPGGEPEKIS